jgi:type II restriction enzyme
MKRKEIIEKIIELSNADISFDDASKKLNDSIGMLPKEVIATSLLECGIIPELYNHDSSEEKLYSKYTDILLAQALIYLGFETTIIKLRADSADVEGINNQYSIVADAKAFRLSRTAKNQKDFKVEALNRWKKDKDYACLVSPLYQYPNTNSQIYRQATDKNVTLLSYAHLYFIISLNNSETLDYSELWTVGRSIANNGKGAISYWKAVDEIICKITGKRLEDLEKAKKLELDYLKIIAKEEEKFLSEQTNRIKNLTHEEAISQLIKKEKIDSKLEQTKKTSGIK